MSFNCTVRADTIESAYDQLRDFVKAKLEDGWLAAPTRDAQEALKYRASKSRANQATATEQGGAAPQQATRQAPPRERAPSAPQAPPAPQGEVKSGTDTLNKVSVDADGRVEFYVGNFRWPFKDSRGPEIVAGLFDSDLGWMPEHFYAGAKYESEVAGLLVDWAKPGKYYDVLRVHTGD